MSCIRTFGRARSAEWKVRKGPSPGGYENEGINGRKTVGSTSDIVEVEVVAVIAFIRDDSDLAIENDLAINTYGMGGVGLGLVT